MAGKDKMADRPEDAEVESLRQRVGELEKTLHAVIQAMSVIIESRDASTQGHQRRVADLAHAIALEMGLSSAQAEGVYLAGMIHDLGNMSVPSDILAKPGPLSESEFGLIKGHSQRGHDILKNIELPWPVAQSLLQHHERMDGSGYPHGTREICLEARILGLADAVEAMISHRPYRPVMALDNALEEIKAHRGTHYDPAVVDACVEVFREGRKVPITPGGHVMMYPRTGRLNCWEFKNCGREPGGSREGQLGICPAALWDKQPNVNGGRFGGRACWGLVGTLCGGKVQGSYAEKIGNCVKCEFYDYVREQEGIDFRYSLRK